MSFKSNVEENGLEETRKAYMLPHNRKEIERMKIQHEWIKGSFGGLIKAPIDYNKKKQKILDSATADGTWIFDASTLFPAETEFVGFDIAPEMFPPSNMLPPNVTLSLMDLSRDLPTEWEQQFDLVHQRFVFPGIAAKQIGEFLDRLMECVKPGGWIQLVEPAANENVSGPDPTAFHVLHKFADKCMQSPDPRDTILSKLKEGGFINVNVETRDIVVGKYQSNRELDVRGRKCMRAAVMNMSAIANAKMLGIEEADWDNLLDRFEADMEKYRTAVRHFIIWAQRP
ncbi:S-adenosyl-L-methionine-dependent methyltransferase [Westerdykella ornata]|uniref:S-adenosyl-L-methionine-dependent methyltransferase n=1 Tax=Westerdykella ornata TaxID=318751 RepID=A0A6A6JVX5_WESOR|nr:S-adenosyl-L-methionine-dependent methyltransferase [Westerdykella ornata]KAF2280364.1 S-adenosyl-L-methionine-dependent methyltransferase [Westerdykella ornata]